MEANNDNVIDKRTKDRLYLGHAWMMCLECGAKLYDFDGNKDTAKPCPYVRDERGMCTDELK